MNIIKNVKRITLGILGTAVLASGLWACSNDDVQSQDTSLDKLARSNNSDFNPNEIGELHNKLMTYIHTSWNDTLSSTTNVIHNISLQEKDHFIEYYKSKIENKYSLKISNLADFYNISYKVNEDYRNTYLEKKAFAESDAYEMTPYLFQKKKVEAISKLYSLEKENLITTKESTFIKYTLQEMDKIENSRRYNEYPMLFEDLTQKYNSLHFEISKKEGLISAIILSVGKNSYIYWDEIFPTEHDGSQYTTTALPVWVGLDAIGAGAAAASSLWSQRNNDNVDWAEVGGQALIWGVGSSIPATRPFTKIFKPKGK